MTETSMTATRRGGGRIGASATFHTPAFSTLINTWMPWRLIWGERCGKDEFARWYQLGPVGLYVW